MSLHWQSFVPQGDLATFGYRSAMKLEKIIKKKIFNYYG
jgi:hypothetical protein